MVQGLEHPASQASGMALIPGQGTKIQAKKKKKKKKALPPPLNGLSMSLSLRETRAAEDGMETSFYPQHLVQSVSP